MTRRPPAGRPRGRRWLAWPSPPAPRPTPPPAPAPATSLLAPRAGRRKPPRLSPLLTRAEQPRRVLPQHLPLDLFAEAVRAELFDVFPRRDDAGRGPVGAPQHFVGDARDVREVARECFRRDA